MSIGKTSYLPICIVSGETGGEGVWPPGQFEHEKRREEGQKGRLEREFIYNGSNPATLPATTAGGFIEFYSYFVRIINSSQ